MSIDDKGRHPTIHEYKTASNTRGGNLGLLGVRPLDTSKLRLDAS